jgi:hypothetical protein
MYSIWTEMMLTGDSEVKDQPTVVASEDHSRVTRLNWHTWTFGHWGRGSCADCKYAFMGVEY